MAKHHESRVTADSFFHLAGKQNIKRIRSRFRTVHLLESPEGAHHYIIRSPYGPSGSPKILLCLPRSSKKFSRASDGRAQPQNWRTTRSVTSLEFLFVSHFFLLFFFILRTTKSWATLAVELVKEIFIFLFFSLLFVIACGKDAVSLSYI